MLSGYLYFLLNVIFSSSLWLEHEQSFGFMETITMLRISSFALPSSPSSHHSLLISSSFLSLKPDPSLHSTTITFASSSSSSVPRRRRLFEQLPQQTNFRRLTSRVVQLTRRRQLKQVIKEIEVAKRRYGKLNVIVMNAVLEACVHCDDIELALKVFDEMCAGCGVDNVTYGTLLKGLGKARRVDEAFQLLESVENGTAAGNPKLSAPLLFGLLNSLVEAVQGIYDVLMALLLVTGLFCMKAEILPYLFTIY